ncbi:MAG: 30S ribosomal protein S16 [Candidatus Omnitrophica bacterium]|nr:30S ribosomal protein S16 [Candidatus Omnitrophota bacterium]
MALVIRLKRIGTNKRPCFRIVVADSRSPRDGRFVEELGTYDPRKNPPFVVIKKDRADHWLQVGAKPSPTVQSLLKKWRKERVA